MKILKVAFKNINSLQGEHTIDFSNEPFENHSLFAITGPTGSGKSTILDVITLALYNEIPRIGRISKGIIEQSGAILTRGQKDAYARVTYRCSRGEFVSQWAISTNRNNNLRDYEMEVADALTGDILTDMKSEVATMNADLIGLSYEQFVKSVMLAQGAFAEFLKVAKNDRGELLEKITGTDIYRQIGQRAYYKYKDFEIEISDLEKQRSNWEEELLEEEKKEELLTSKKTIFRLIEELKEKENFFKKKIEHKKNITRQQKEIDELTSQLQELLKSIEVFEKNEGNELQKHQLTEPVSEELVSWRKLNESLKKNGKKKTEVQENLTAIQQKKANLERTIYSLIQKEVPESEILSSLKEFEKQVQQLQQEKKDLSKDCKSLQEQINTETKAIQKSFSFSELAAFEKDIQEMHHRAKDSIVQLQKQFTREEWKNAEQTSTKFEKRSEELFGAKALADKWQLLNQEKRKKMRTKEEIEKRISGLPTQTEEVKRELEREETRLENLELKRLVASLEDHRKNLTQGEACPLCGSKNHPFTENDEWDYADSQDDAIQNQKNTVNSLREKVATLTKSLTDEEKNLHTIQEEIETTNKQVLTVQEEFHEKYKEKPQTDWNKKIEEHKEKQQRFKQLHEAMKTREITTSVKPKLESLRKAVKKGQKISEKLKKLYNGNEPVSKFTDNIEQQFNQLRTNKKLADQRLKQISETLQEAEKEKNQVRQSLQNFIEKSNIPSIWEALNYRIPFEKVKRLTQKNNELKEQKIHLQTKADTARKQLAALKKEDAAQPLAQMEKEYENILGEKERKQTHLEEINRQLKNHSETLRKVDTLTKTIEQKNKETRQWRLLREEIGDSTGNKFNTFAQELTLLQLLQLANKRLEVLSKRYLIANPEKDEDDSLTIIDKDMGGLRRSVNTLSGGETFVISLALALALSDLASKNIQIESLFIDEGFGTLDPETLDQTLDTLERLQQENSKLIGVISHVEALKERITTQVQLQQNGRGFSEIQIVG